MSWENIATTVVSLLGALGGWEAVKYLINRKSNKRMEESEADKKETEADSDEFHLYKERIDELRLANAELNKQNLELLKAGSRKDEIIEDKTKKIRELNELRVRDIRRIGQLEKMVQFFKSWFCKREYGNGRRECKRREPAQNPPLKFEPLQDDTVADTD